MKGPDRVSRGAIVSQHHHSSNAGCLHNHAMNPIIAYPRHPAKLLETGFDQAQARRSPPEIRGSTPIRKESRAKSELQGVVLTLASPGSDRGRV